MQYGADYAADLQDVMSLFEEVAMEYVQIVECRQVTLHALDC